MNEQEHPQMDGGGDAPGIGTVRGLALIGIVWGCMLLVMAAPVDWVVSLAIFGAAIWIALIGLTVKILCGLFPPAEPQPPPPSRKGRRKRCAT